MNADTFIQKLDTIRSEARTQFGMKQNQVVFDSKPVQNLIKLVEALYNEGHKKHQDPRVTAAIQAKADDTPVEVPTDIPVLVIHEPDQTGSESTSAKQPPMTHTPLPREPKPVHPVDVVEATEATVVKPAGGWQDGDI